VVEAFVSWARNFGPELFDLWSDDLEHLNDDRVGRCLDRVFQALDTNLIMDVVTHVVREFDVRLDELHNDSATITFHGDHPTAQQERVVLGQRVPAITWGHNKDHRPDLKQLLYILTVSNDGGVPVYFQAASGNVVDDKTHQATWRETPESITWREVHRTEDEDGELLDVFSVHDEDHVSKEGYRVLWFHSRGKADSDAQARGYRLQRAIYELVDLRERLLKPRTRFRNSKPIFAWPRCI